MTDTILTIAVFSLLFMIGGYLGYRSLKRILGSEIPAELRSRLWIIGAVYFLMFLCLAFSISSISDTTFSFSEIRFGQILLWCSLFSAIATAGFIIRADISQRKIGNILLVTEIATWRSGFYVPTLILFSSFLIAFAHWFDDIEVVMRALAIASFSFAVLLSRQSTNLLLITAKGLFYNGSLLKWNQISSYHWLEKSDDHVVLGIVIARKIPFFRTGYYQIPRSQQHKMETLLGDYVSRDLDDDSK